MSRHPLIGQAYTVIDYDTPVFQADTLVPIGTDDFGNLQVDQYAGDRERTVLYNPEEFVRAVTDGEVECDA